MGSIGKLMVERGNKMLNFYVTVFILNNRLRIVAFILWNEEDFEILILVEVYNGLLVNLYGARTIFRVSMGNKGNEVAMV